MARMYRTSSAMPMDYMYRQNTPLMEHVALRNDQYITDNLAQLGRIGDAAASFNYLTPDNERANEIVQGYTSQIDEITKAIRADPAAWRDQVGKVRDVANELKNNYKTGEISKIAGNYNTYKQAADYIDKQVESYNKGKGGISAEEGTAFKQHFLKEFGGTNYKSPTEYGAVKAYNPGNTVNLEKFLGEELDKIKADKKSWSHDEITGQDMYFNQKKGSWEGVTPAKILEIVMDRAKNPIVQNYLRERSSIGMIKNAYDANGNMLNPFEQQTLEATPEQNKVINEVKAQIAKEKNPQRKAVLENRLEGYTNQINAANTGLSWQNEDGSDRSVLSPVIRGLVTKNSYSQSSEENNLRNNALGTARFNQAQQNFRQGRDLAQKATQFAQKQAAAKDMFDQRLKYDYYKHDNPHFAPKAGTGTTKKTTIDGKEVPEEQSSISRLSTHSFEDMYVTDKHGKALKLFTPEGLNADLLDKSEKLLASQKRLDQIAKILPNYDLNEPQDKESYNRLKVEYEDLRGAHNKMLSDFNQSRQWRDQTTEAVLGNNPSTFPKDQGALTPDEIATYKKFEGDRDGQKLKALVDENSHSKFSTIMGGLSAKRLLANVKGDAQRDSLEKYMKVLEKVNERKGVFLNTIRSTPIDTDAVKLGTQDSQAVSDMIFNDTNGMNIFNASGERTDGVVLDSKGVVLNPSNDNRKISFVGGDLQKYLAENPVKVHINKIGNSTKIGNGGAVAEVIFEDDNGGLDRTPYYIELTPHVQKSIATRLMHNNKDPELQKLAGGLVDEAANDVRRQLITPSANKNLGVSNENEPVVTTIYIKRGDRKIPFQVTKFSGSEGTHLEVSGYNQGALEPVPFGSAGMNGWFSNTEDFIQQAKAKGLIK